MKITPKPIAHSDKINKSRDVSGMRQWSRESRIVGTFMAFLGWFTVPAEAYTRNNFGRRWMTPGNFYAGLFLFVVLGSLQYLYDKIRYWVMILPYSWNPFFSENSISGPNYAGTVDMIVFAIVYVCRGTFHLARIWWRKKINMELHFYDDGTSWLEPFGKIFMIIINLVAVPFLYIYVSTLPDTEKKLKPLPKLISDRAAFTDSIVEPLLFVWLASISYGFVAVWFYTTAFAVAIHAGQKNSARQNKLLDYQDSLIEAKVMADMKNIGKSDANRSAAERAKKAASNLTGPIPNPVQYPDLHVIIDEMNREKTRQVTSVLASLQSRADFV